MRGKLIALKTNGWVGRRIRKLTNSNWNHLGLFINGGEYIEASMWGVRKTHLHKTVTKALKGKLDFGIYRIKASPDKIEKLVKLVEKQVGKSYDFFQMLSIGLFLFFGISRKIEPIDIRDSWLCSELIGEPASNVGIVFAPDIDPDNLTPSDILDSDLVEREHVY